MGDREPDFGKADLTNCDREPIHIPGAIQPHGVLLALDAASLKVVQIAGDTERLLGIRPCDMLGRASLEASIGPAQLDHLRAMLAKARPIPRPMFAFQTVVQRGTATLDAIVHLTEGIVVVELEPRLGEAIGNPLMLVQEMVNGLQQAASLGAFLQAAADQVRASTGFDRVMVYKFQPDDSGAVVAEARGGDVESFLGLHYPASDIPKQARRLYLQNWMRLIPDARYTPAPLTPTLNPITNQPLDLTSSVLRSVSPIHLEYLANMGVVASMSLSLVVDGKLWGLIACHHAAPKYLPHTLRSACELFVEMASLQLAEKIAREEQGDRLRANAIHALLVEAMSQEHRLAEALIRHRPNLLDYIPAESVAIWSDAELTTEGRAPSNEQISQLIEWLNDNVGEGVFVSDHLSEHYPPAKEYADVASGLIALSISRTPRDYVLWFRPEVIEMITWAGNPDKPVEAHGGSERLSPRKSFAAWREMVRGRSRAWGPCPLEAAQALRTSILEVVLRRLDQVAHERDKARGQQDMLMAELDHRVKNIIALIQSLAEYSAAGAENLESFTRVFRQRLQALGNAQNLLSDGRWKGAPLRTIIEEGAAPFGDGRVFVAGPMVVVQPKAALSLALAMHELATNASKYGALSIPGGRVEVTWHAEGTGGEQAVILNWIEKNGPPVAPPAKAGFGCTLLQRSLAFDLDGKVEISFAPEGVSCTIAFPSEHIVKSRTQNAHADTMQFQGKRILVVEDQAFVAMHVQDILEEQGVAVIGPLARLKDALVAAEQEKFDAALVDIDLNGELSWPIADVLLVRGKPFAFTTGFQTAKILPERFSGVMSLRKPYVDRDVLDVVSKLLRQCQNVQGERRPSNNAPDTQLSQPA